MTALTTTRNDDEERSGELPMIQPNRNGAAVNRTNLQRWCFLALLVVVVGLLFLATPTSLPAINIRRLSTRLSRIEEVNGDFPSSEYESYYSFETPAKPDNTPPLQKEPITLPVALPTDLVIPTEETTTTTTTTTSSSPREKEIRTVLSIVVGGKVNIHNSPYGMAMEWILHKDPLRLSATSENLVQRYVLALFYYQTSRQGPWKSCNPPAIGQNSSCVNYEMQRLPDNSIEYVPTVKPDTRWLSRTHECQWAFVQCSLDDHTVTTLDILGQDLTGTLPLELVHLQDLEWLSLSFNRFVGTIPTQYATQLTKLKIFECTENLLTGPVPPAFYENSNLLQLNLAYNMFTGTLPTTIGNMTSLHSVFFFNTLLEGTLPTELGKLENLHNLWMFDNMDLAGPIPSEIGHLSLLEDLKLSHNRHTGPLPSELGRLANLQEFFIAYNPMGAGATIPEEIWDLPRIVYLDWDGAGLGGTLSTHLGKATSLQGIKASRNQFTGTLPTEVGLLTDLVLLWVHINPRLTGSVPDEVCRLRWQNDLTYLNADCYGNDPTLFCKYGCCTGCCDEFGSCRLV